MEDFLDGYYDLLRCLHIISVMAWMAGMLYLPRLFVYHVKAEKGGELSETLKIMERRLLKIIINPAMVLSWVFGGLLLYASWEYYSKESWMHVKFGGILLMTGVHHMYIKYLKAFAADNNQKTEKFFRILNEVPTLLMIIIVVMAVMEPF